MAPSDPPAPATADLDISPQHLALVRAILARHVPDRTVVAFGSRATGTAKPWSDLDLAILGDERLPVVVLARLALDFEESTLPFRVDVVQWAAASEAFRARIESDGSTVQEGVSTAARG